MVNHNTYYQRQIVLDEVGESGQLKLKNTTVLIIGAGGLGSPLLSYLVSAGVGNIRIFDFDIVEESNLHRQNLFSPTEIGTNKAEAAKNILEKKNPLINIQNFNERFCETTSIAGVDIIIDCSDNLKSKFIAHDLAYKNKIKFCMASIYKFEGQIQFFNFTNPKGCLRCLWTDIPSKTCVQTCEEAGVIGATAGIIGSVQAMEVIKSILGLNTITHNETLIINLLDFKSLKLKNPVNSECSLCSNHSTQKPSSYSSQDDELELNLEKYLAQDFYTISLVPNQSNKLSINLFSSLTTLNQDLPDSLKYENIAVFCQRGITSLKAVKALRALGYRNAFSVSGGINHLKEVSK